MRVAYNNLHYSISAFYPGENMFSNILPFFLFSTVIFFTARLIGWHIKKRYCTFPSTTERDESSEKEEGYLITFDSIASFFTQVLFYIIVVFCFLVATFALLVYLGPL